jgi:hypothetical protein
MGWSDIEIASRASIGARVEDSYAAVTLQVFEDHASSKGEVQRQPALDFAPTESWIHPELLERCADGESCMSGTEAFAAFGSPYVGMPFVHDLTSWCGRSAKHGGGVASRG